jgi:hypothetical protein
MSHALQVTSDQLNDRFYRNDFFSIAEHRPPREANPQRLRLRVIRRLRLLLFLAGGCIWPAISSRMMASCLHAPPVLGSLR